MTTQPKKLKRVVIKEELVALTDNYIHALILNQFIYWSERRKDFDKFIAEEKRRNEDLKIEMAHGWIYKSSEELSDELMLGMSPATIRRHITKLTDSGYLDQRNNPDHKWDRTIQYRPNMVKIQSDLQALGYALEGYPLLTDNAPFFKMKNASLEMKNQTSQNENAIPEITPEITTKIPKGKEKPPAPLKPKTIIKDRFLELTGLQMPTAKNDIGFWWGRFGEIIKIFADDTSRAVEGVAQVVEYMTAEGLTITGPQSIVNLCRAVAAGQKLKGRTNNGTYKKATSQYSRSRPEELRSVNPFQPAYAGPE